MTIENTDVLLVNRGTDSYQIKYEKIKTDITDSVNQFPDVDNDGVQYGRQDGTWTPIVHTPEYTNADVDAHLRLNVGSDSSGKVLSYDGSQYVWITDDTGDGASTADKISYQYPGGVSRSVQNRLEDYVSVKDFGAVGDGSTDDTTAFQAALNIGKAVHIPSGEYRITSTLSFSGKNVSIIGDGVRNTLLTFELSNGADGIDIDIDEGVASEYTAHLEGFRIDTRNPGPNRAIHIHSNDGMGEIYRHAYINNLRVSGRWLQGIDLLNTVTFTVSNVIMGLSVGTEGLLARGFCTDSTISNVNIHNVKASRGAGIYINAETEGIHVDNCTIINCNSGIYWEAGTAGEPALYVTNTHTNTAQYGIYANKVIQMNITGCLFYGDTFGDLQNWDGIYIKDGGQDSVISGNIFHAAGRNGSQTDAGVEIDGQDTSNPIVQHRLSISDNIFTGLDYGIYSSGDNNINQIVATDNVFNNVGIQKHTPFGNIASAHLESATDRVDFEVANNGSQAKLVNLSLQSSGKELKLVSQADGDARTVFDGTMTFATKASGNAVNVMDMKSDGHIDIYGNCVVNQNFYLYTPDRSKRFLIGVNNNGDLFTIEG